MSGNVFADSQIFNIQWCFKAALNKKRVWPLLVFKQWNADDDPAEEDGFEEQLVISSIAFTTNPFNLTWFEIDPGYPTAIKFKSSLQLLNILRIKN